MAVTTKIDSYRVNANGEWETVIVLALHDEKIPSFVFFQFYL